MKISVSYPGWSKTLPVSKNGFPIKMKDARKIGLVDEINIVEYDQRVWALACQCDHFVTHNFCLHYRQFLMSPVGQVLPDLGNPSSFKFAVPMFTTGAMLEVPMVFARCSPEDPGLHTLRLNYLDETGTPRPDKLEPMGFVRRPFSLVEIRGIFLAELLGAMRYMELDDFHCTSTHHVKQSNAWDLVEPATERPQALLEDGKLDKMLIKTTYCLIQTTKCADCLLAEAQMLELT